MLPKTAEYALRVVAWLAGNPTASAAGDVLAERTLIPRRYLQKVLADLTRAGLVQSRPGPGGGYLLTRDPKRISILDVVASVSPLERIRRCPVGLTSHTELCPLHRALDDAYAATERAYAGVTLASLVKSTHAIAPLCDIA